MDQHGRGEIPIREEPGDMTQMLPDLVAAGGVLGFVRLDLDDAAVSCQAEVVRRLRMVKAHNLIAPCVDLREVLIMGVTCCGMIMNLRGDRGLLCRGHCCDHN